MLQFRLLRMAFVPWMIFAFAVASTGVYSFITVPSVEALTTFSIKAGGYYGNGASLSISGLGFTPEAVIVRSDAALSSIWQSSAASGTTATYLGIVTADNTGSGIALSADGFTVSPVPETNTVNIHYTYFALAGSGCSPEGMLCVGLYTGDGTASRTISVGNSSTSTASNVVGSFTVGLADNTNGNVYHYVAFKNVTPVPAYESVPSSGGGSGSPTTGGGSLTGGSDPGDPGQSSATPGDVGTVGESTGETGVAPSSESSSSVSVSDAVGFGISNSVTGAVASAIGIGPAPSSPAAVGMSAVGLGLSMGLGPVGMAVAIGLAVADSVTNGQVSNAVDGFFGGVLSAIGNAVIGVANAVTGFFGGLFGDEGTPVGEPGYGLGESAPGTPGSSAGVGSGTGVGSGASGDPGTGGEGPGGPGAPGDGSGGDGGGDGGK